MPPKHRRTIYILEEEEKNYEEICAIACYQARSGEYREKWQARGKRWPTWEELPKNTQELYRKMANAVIATFIDVTVGDPENSEEQAVAQ
jgi:hypothetical protein